MPALASPFGLGTRLAASVLVAGVWLAPAPAAAPTRTILASLAHFIGTGGSDPPFPLASNLVWCVATQPAMPGPDDRHLHLRAAAPGRDDRSGAGPGNLGQ